MLVALDAFRAHNYKQGRTDILFWNVIVKGLVATHLLACENYSNFGTREPTAEQTEICY